MRQLFAFILLIPLFALFIEAVKAPANCNTTATMKCSMMNKMNSKCMMAMKNKCKKGNCGKSECCIDCPLCYVVTFKPAINFEIVKPVNKPEYSVMLIDNLSDYSSQHWKPPNSLSR